MANSVATLVVQTELLPSETPSSLSPFPSLLPSVGEEDNDEEKGADDEKETEAVVLTGVEMVTSSTSPGTVGSQNPEHPFQCLDCGKSFKWSSRLAHHQRSHNNERPYRCNLCPKAFKGSSALLYHQRSHSGEKPYKCEDCGKAFKRSSLLQVHRSVHTGLRTFQCPYCPLTFKWSSHYQYHLRQHTGECPYPCDRCPKAFKNSSSLRRHKNVHLGVKPYVCMVCNKAFSQSTNLRQHMRIHTGERPYICGECGRSFTHSSNLALHRNSHIEVKAQDGGKTGKVGSQTNVEVVLERATSEDLKAVEMTISDMVGLVGGQEGGTSQVFLSHHVPSSCTSSSAEGSQSVRTATGSEHVQVSMEESAETGANVLLYSCGSCNETFGTQTHLEEHQALHLHSLGAVDGGEDMRGDGIEAQGGGVSLVGMAPLLADFEEVVETTTVSDNGQGSELLGLGGIGGGSGQVQYDLLQSFTSSVAQMPSDDTTSIVDTTVATLSECAYCDKSFKSSSSMSRHMAQVHPLALSQSRSQFNCSVCDRSFPLLSSLLTHQLSHTEEQRLLAEAEAEIICPPSLSLSVPLSSSSSAKREGEEEEGEREIHVSLIAVTEEGERQSVKPGNRATGKTGRRGGRSKGTAANNERPYRCTECGKSFKGSSGLRYHMRDHTGERPYRCTECGKSFKRSSLLSIHQRVHTGVRAFQCPYCTLTFKWSSHFQYHLRQHTGERPYVCQECGKSFKNTSCLRRHSQLHSGLRPHACSVCGRTFSQTSNLKQHERTHSGERPFQCAQCHKTFTHSSNLQLHVRTHSSRKDYKCQHCGKEFIIHSYLQRHLQTHSSAAGATCTKEAGKTAKNDSGTSEVSTSTLNLNMNTAGGLSSLFANEGNSTLILSPSNLDIPPNTSQNYFMIQTPTGLQLIPLSNPTPTQPVPAPPPPPPSQNFLLLQCQSTNGSQPSLILVPTASNTNTLPVPPAPRPLPLVQTIPTLPHIATLAPAQTHISQFQPLQTQHRFIFTNNSTPLITAPPQNTSAITRPILGTLSPNRSPRTRRGRKNKTPKSGSLEQTPPSVPATQGLVPSTVSTTTACVALSPTSSQQRNVQPPLNSDSVPDTTSTPATETVTATTPLTNSHCNLTSDHQNSFIAEKVKKPPEPLAEERFVLCFEKEAEERERGGEMEVAMNDGVEGERSYVLHFEGESEQGEEGGEERGEKSYILRFQSGEEMQGDGEKEKTGMVSLNLLQEWSEAGGGGERMEGFEEGVGVEEKAYVLHFHEDDPNDDVPPNAGFPEGPSKDLGLSCHSAQALMPLGGQEVVFELGSEDKIDADTSGGESVQMIAVIEGGDSSSETGGSFTNPGGVTGAGAGQMGSIFQLEGGEGIVIIEVSTSSLTEGTEGVSVGLRNLDKESTESQEVASEEQKILETESRLSASVNGT